MIHIVFDLDGTLADTQNIHQSIESDFLLSKGVMIAPNNIGNTYAGRSPIEWIPECLREHRASFDMDEVHAFVDSKDEKVIELLHVGKIHLMDGVAETLTVFKQKGYKMGISSGACRAFIDDFIQYFHLDMLEASTSADEVVNKKPAPDVFLSTFEKLEKLSMKPNEKWVIGDGKTDIIGGNASGAKTVLCYNTFSLPYTHRIDNFSELISLIK